MSRALVLVAILTAIASDVAAQSQPIVTRPNGTARADSNTSFGVDGGLDDGSDLSSRRTGDRV